MIELATGIGAILEAARLAAVGGLSLDDCDCAIATTAISSDWNLLTQIYPARALCRWRRTDYRRPTWSGRLEHEGGGAKEAGRRESASSGRVGHDSAMMATGLASRRDQRWSCCWRIRYMPSHFSSAPRDPLRVGGTDVVGGLGESGLLNLAGEFASSDRIPVRARGPGTRECVCRCYVEAPEARGGRVAVQL